MVGRGDSSTMGCVAPRVSSDIISEIDGALCEAQLERGRAD